MHPSPSTDAGRRTGVLAAHFLQPEHSQSVRLNSCLSYHPPDVNESYLNPSDMRPFLDGHNMADRDWLFGIMVQSNLFNPRLKGGNVYVTPDYNQTMEQQREITLQRIKYLVECGVFDGWLTGKTEEDEWRKLALSETIGIFDHSLSVKLGVHFFLWGDSIKFFGTRRHHIKWLENSENYKIKGCFAMTELGHGSNVRGIETMTTYDSSTGEFIINTPCESAQKYWIGGAAEHATHAIVFSQLNINGTNHGVHAFIAQIRDCGGKVLPNVRVADCGHKIGLNGVDNGRIWFDNLRVPRENLLNSVADVSPEGVYSSAIKDPDQRFAAFLAPLTSGRVTLAVGAIYSSKISLAIAIRYSLTRRAFSITPSGAETLLLDYPSHQRRLLPLLAKTYAMSFAANRLKMLYIKRSPATTKNLHVISSALKAFMTWHNMRTLQECREACGGQGVKTDNRIGQLKSELDVQTTFEGDNNVLLQQVSKALLSESLASNRKGTVPQGLILGHVTKTYPATSPSITNADLRSSQFQMDMFCLREQDLLARLSADVLRRQKGGDIKEVAFLQAFRLAEDLCRAFVDRIILTYFVEALATVETTTLKYVLNLVRSLYVLSCMDEDATFLRYGHVTPEDATCIRDEVTKLCGELRPHALALVDSFGIPPAFLGPIAHDWILANSWPPNDH